MEDWMTEMMTGGPFFEPGPDGKEAAVDRFAPIFTIHETRDAYELTAEVPGATPGDVEVMAHEHDVFIRCKHAIDHEHEADPTAPAFGVFKRRFTFAHPIDAVHVDTSVAAGVLAIRALKRPN